MNFHHCREGGSQSCLDFFLAHLLFRNCLKDAKLDFAGWLNESFPADTRPRIELSVIAVGNHWQFVAITLLPKFIRQQ